MEVVTDMKYSGHEYEIHFLPADKKTEIQAMDLLYGAARQDDTDLLPLEPKDIAGLLRQPGTLRFFQKEAVWRGGNRKVAIGQLCRELEKAAAGAQAEFGGSMRLLFRVTACADIQLEEVEQVAEALTAHLSGKQMALFCARTAPNVESGYLQVQCLIGALDSSR